MIVVVVVKPGGQSRLIDHQHDNDNSQRSDSPYQGTLTDALTDPSDKFSNP
jgi:hypothetical protein